MSQTAAEAAQRAAEAAGAHLYSDAAERVAEAVLAHADDHCGLRRVIPADTWVNEGFQAYILREMRHELLREITDRELVPVSPPVQTIRYLIGLFGAVEVPTDLAESGQAPYDEVQVELRVGVRRGKEDHGSGRSQG